MNSEPNKLANQVLRIFACPVQSSFTYKTAELHLHQDTFGHHLHSTWLFCCWCCLFVKIYLQFTSVFKKKKKKAIGYHRQASIFLDMPTGMR